MRECVNLEPNRYQNASDTFKACIEIALLFLKQGGSFCFLGKHLRKE